MSCYCDYDGEAPTVYRPKLITKARNPHKCYECHRKINPGESYENLFAIWDGDASTCCTCQHCLELRNYVVAHVPCSCWTHGNMIEEVMRDANAFAHEAPGLLFGAYRRKVQIDRARRA